MGGGGGRMGLVRVSCAAAARFGQCSLMSSSAAAAAAASSFQHRTGAGGGCGGPGTGRLILGARVREALANGEPVVGLESALITHGLPKPHDLEVALEMERQVSGAGSVPATVGILGGRACVGLSHGEICELAERGRLGEGENGAAMKASRRDLAVALARNAWAGTTVAGTLALLAAAAPQVRVFATGGSGGVHRGGEATLDVSADLYELARSPIGLVSSGFKSFLDTRRSLEYLETLGCTVMSLGLEKAFPAFFTRATSNQVESPCRVETLEEAARIMFWGLEGLAEGLSGSSGRRSTMLAVPIPKEWALDGDGEAMRRLEEIGAEIDKRQDLEGRAKTPLILAQLNRATQGASLRANIGLLENNARVGGQLAREYAQVRARSGAILPPPPHQPPQPPPPTSRQGQEQSEQWAADPPQAAPSRPQANNNNNEKEKEDGEVLVVGATMLDLHVSAPLDARFRSNPAHSGATFEGRPHLALGGVGQNLARALCLLGHRNTNFVTSLGDDELGAFARSQLAKLLPPNQLHVVRGDSSDIESCFALVLMDSLTGRCEFVVANLDACRLMNGHNLKDAAKSSLVERARLVVCDANLPASGIAHLLAECRAHQVPLFVEPTDVLALPQLLEALEASERAPLFCLSPNLLELNRMLELLEGASFKEDGDECEPPLELVERKARRLMELHLPQLACLLVTLDRRGCLLGLRGLGDASISDEELGRLHLLELPLKSASGGPEKLHFLHRPPPQLIERPVSASGAGDSFAAGFISGLLRRLELAQCLALGFQAAQVALQHRQAIPGQLAQLSGWRRQ